MPTIQTARYFVLCRFSKGATAFIERDTADMDLQTTVNDILSLQIENPVQVFCAEGGHWTDATEQVAQLVCDRAAAQGLVLDQPVLEFIAEHVGLRNAYALGMAAA